MIKKTEYIQREIKPYYKPVINSYYENEGKKLRDLVNLIFNRKFGGITDKDMDEFYSVANDVFTDIVLLDRYDKAKGNFDGFLYSALELAFIDEFKRQNRSKRVTKVYELDEYGNKVLDKNGKPKLISLRDVSLDAPVKAGEEMTYRDKIQGDSDIICNSDEDCNENVERYLKSLGKIPRQIIQMKMNGIPVAQIKKILAITDSQYNNYMNSAKMNENIALFRKKTNSSKEENNMRNIIPIDLTDNYRMDKFPLGTLLDDMRDGKINRKHILQRKAYQWSERQKNKFLTRVLNNQPIPEIVICEQNVRGKKKSHLIDGLQRLSYSELFRADGIIIKIDGAEFYEIPYREYLYDENGNVLLDEDGDAKFEEKTFNVIGKKFSEFPVFLKERFNKFNINVTTYFNCTDEQIAYHIRNYNNQEGMNRNQYEFTSMDVNIAEKIKNISDNHPFFKDGIGKYTDKNKIKGDLDRVVVESIMAINFLENWKKEVKDSVEFVNSNATDEMFTSLKESLDRLYNVVDKSIKDMFTTTNSPVWFAVFETFKKLNLPDIRFKEFMNYFKDSIDGIKVDGVPFVDTYKLRNTKDKSVVTAKVNGIISIMLDYLHIDMNVEESDEMTSVEFISNMVDIPLETVKEDIDCYKETLNDLERNVIKDGSKLLDKRNRLSLLALVAYSFKADKDLDDWLEKFARKNNTYIADQAQNYSFMKKDFEKYCRQEMTA